VSRSGFHVIDVHHHVGNVPSLMAQVSESGAQGMELDLTPFRDPSDMEIRLAVMDANGIDQAVVIPTHEYLRPAGQAYAGSPDEAPWMVTELAKTLPEVPMIVLDGFSGLERSAKEISIAAATMSNLVFDTSLAYSFDIVERFVANFGAERVLFGTDMYSPPLAYRKSTVLEQLFDSGLDDDQ
jgi:hypothetical protein